MDFQGFVLTLSSGLTFLNADKKSSDSKPQKENENIWEFLLFLIYNI